MKKNILITCLVVSVIGLIAFGSFSSGTAGQKNYVATPCKVELSEYTLTAIRKQKEKTEIFYGFGPRFMMTKTKEELKNIRSVLDFNSCDNPESIVSFSKVSVVVLDYNYNYVKQVDGTEGEFNAAQLELLNSVPYSTDLLVRADFKQFRMLCSEMESNYTSPHITVVPEKQAVYTEGADALVDYVESRTSQYSALIGKEDLRPGKVRFTVSVDGSIENVFLESTSGSTSFDDDVIRLIGELPESWTPAEDAKGNKVDQQLVFTFGIVGC